MPEWVTPVIVAIVSGLMVLVGNIVIQKVRGKRADPPTWPQMWERIQALEVEIREVREAQEASDRRWVSTIITMLEAIPRTTIIELPAEDYEFVKSQLPAYHLARLRARPANA